MHDYELINAVLGAAEHGAPPRVFEVGPNADVRFGDAPMRHPFEGATFTTWPESETHWSHDG